MAEPTFPPRALTEPWSDLNPWTDEYLERERASMESLRPYRHAHVRLLLARITGIVDCYMRQDFLEWGPYPHLSQGRKVWMSITPREIETHYLPIRVAEGRVGIGGLGLGYAAARIASKAGVDEVIVYETNPTIIRLWHRNFGPDVPKITIAQQDVATVRDQSFDFFYNDTYYHPLQRDTFEHWNELTNWNDIGWYHPWFIEALLMRLVVANRQSEIPFGWRDYGYFHFLQRLLEATQQQEHGVLDLDGAPPIERVDEMLAILRPDLWSDS